MKNLLIAIISLLLIGCSSDENDVPILSEIKIESDNGNVLVVNQTTLLTIIGSDQNNNLINAGSDIKWTVDNNNVAISQNGLAEGLKAGVSIITAKTQDLIAIFEITVEDKVLSNLIINSSNGNKLDLNETTTLIAQGLDQVNNTMTISSVITWTSNNSNVTVDQNGLATGKVVGNSVITVDTEGIQSTISITVWDSSAPRTEIYVSDVGVNRNGPHYILKYDEDGQNGSVFISTNLSNPQDIVFLEDQNIVIISNLQSNNINKYGIDTGDYLGVFASGLNGPTRLEIGPDDLIYAIQWNGGFVKRYNKDGSFVDNFTSININQAIGIAWDTDGNLYVSSFNNGSNGFVLKFDLSGNGQGLFINANLAGPTDIWFDKEGNMLVNDWSANKVKKFNASGSFTGDFITGLSQPEGVDFLDGNILIGNSGNGSVKMYDENGTFVKDIVSSGSAGLTTTNAVTVRHVN